MKAVTSEFEENADAEQKLTRQKETLNKTIQKQEEKLKLLQEGLQKSKETYDDDAVQTMKWQQAVNDATTALNKSKQELAEQNDALKKNKESTEELAEANSTLATVGKAAMAAIAAAAIAAGKVIADVVKASLDAVGDYEQLIGGVETLFGEETAKTVIKNAERAYETAGLSANKYMETVTSFSASLLQGLAGDTEEAAKLADLALVDMSDNVSKMGSNMDSVMSAYQGFAKRNFTLLDNLKLGYGGTATEMVRLINDANKLDSTILGVNKEITKIDEVSFDQIIRAIHAVQDDMGITGTTAKEAATTIQGSMASAKAAWDNFLSGAGNVDDFVKAFDIALDNIVSNLKVIVPRVTQGLVEIADKIMPIIPDVINDLLPAVIKGISSLVKGVIKALPKLLKTLGKALAENIDSVLAVAWIPIAAFSTKLTASFAKMKTAMAGGFAGIGASLSKWATSFGGILTIVTALAGAVALLNQAWKETPMGRLATEAKELADQQQRLAETAEQTAAQVESEYGYYQRLADELDTIVDSNGKITEGYETRAQVIVNELAEALGIELEIVGDEVVGWENVSLAIDKAIEKKKAYALIEAHDEEYKEAISGEAEALENLGKAYRILQDKEDAYEEHKNGRPGVAAEYKRQYDEALDVYNTWLGIYMDGQQSIMDMDAALAAFEEGNYDKITGIYGGLSTSFIDYTSATEAEMESYIADMQAKIAVLTQLYKDTGEEQYQTMADSLQQTLDETTKGWGSIQTASVEGAKDTAAATEKVVDDEFPKIGKNIVLGVEGGIDKLMYRLQHKARQMALAAKRAAEDELGIQSPSKVFKQIGEYVAEGLAEGIEEKTGEVVKAVKAITIDMADLGEELLDRVNRALLKHSEKAKYSAETDYAAAMREATSLAEFMGLAYAREAKIVGEGIDLTKEGYKSTQELLLDFMNSGKSTIGQLNKFLDSGAKGITASVSETKTAADSLKSAGDKMQEIVSTAGFDKAGVQAVNGFAAGLENYDAVQNVIKKAKNLARHALDALKAGLDEHSPSREMMKVGELATQGFAIGLTKGITYVNKAMGAVVTATSGLSGAIPAPQPTMSSLMAGAVNGIAASNEAASGGSLTVNLVMPDGKRLAQETIKDFIAVGRANGTPITAY